MQEAFSRAELLLGKKALETLAQAHVLLFGVGGVGSYAAEALARSGIGAISLVDDDTVSCSNINRQLIALHSTIGKPKIEVMAQRILDINPNCKVTLHRTFVTKETISQFDFSQYDYVVDAIDTVSAKLALAEQTYAVGTPLISAMGAGNKTDPTKFEVTDIYSTTVCPLARVMRKELRKRHIPALKVVYSTEEALTPKADNMDEINFCPATEHRAATMRRQTPGSLAFVPSVAGLLVAGEVVRDLCGLTRE